MLFLSTHLWNATIKIKAEEVESTHMYNVPIIHNDFRKCQNQSKFSWKYTEQ